MLQSDQGQRRAPFRVPRSRLHGGEGIVMRALVSLAIIAAAMLTRLGLMGAPPEFDELYHYIPALEWLDSGALRILDGTYTRAAAYTLAVGHFLELTGQQSLSTARVVSLVPGVLLPLALFWWLRGRVGDFAAGTATAFAVLWPQGILESQLLRFYSLHVLLIFGGAVAVYAAATGRGRARWFWAAAALALLGAATLLQITTVVACGGIAVWLIGWGFMTIRPDRRWAWGLGCVLLAFVALAVAWSTGALEKALYLFRFSPSNAMATRDYVGFYHNGMRRAYETFWPLFPVAAVLALRMNARLASFCLAIFGTVFLVQSFGAMKADRYISGAMPFFFTIWGMAVARLWQIIRPHVPAAVMWCCIGFLLASNSFVVSSAKLTAGSGYDTRYRPDFAGAPDLLAPWRDVAFLATTHELNMVAELGDYDVDLRAQSGWDAEFDSAALFGRDPRTGRFAVRGEAGMTRLLGCVRTGVLVTVGDIWSGDRIGGAFRRAAGAQDLALEIRRSGAIVAVRWAGTGIRRCEDVPDL